MISKRNFFSITLIMIVLLFLFQFSMVVRDTNNDYNVNSNVSKSEFKSKDAFESKAVEKNYVLYVGNKDSKIENKASQWATYSKYNFVTKNKMDSVSNIPKLIILESEEYIDGYIDQLHDYASQGCVIVVAKIKDVHKVSQSKSLQSFLGIQKVKQEKIHLKGIKLFKDLLIGDETLYQAQTKKEKKERQDLKLDVPWIQTTSGTKTYMVGMLSKKYDKVKNENLPTLVWRNGYKGGSIYCVVGNYLEKNAGLGFLTGMMSQANEVYAYPVVNAQNLSIIGYPDFADENNDKMFKMYSATGVSRDVFLPSLISLSQNAKMKMTWFIQPQYNYLDGISPNSQDIVFYLKQLNEQDSEAGLSLNYTKISSFKSKLNEDEAFLSNQKNKYLYASCYVKEKDFSKLSKNAYPILKDVKTLVLDENQTKPILSYDRKNHTIQRLTSDISDYKYSDDLNMQGIQSSLGYTNAYLNMKKVYDPTSKKDDWQKLQEKASSNLLTYWKDYKTFESTTISKSEARVRKFLSLNYSQKLKGDTFTLNTTKKNSYFICRIQNKKIKEISGGTYKKVRDGIFLIHAKDKNVKIILEDSSLKYGE